MDKIAEFIKDNLGAFLTTCLGLLVPGALTIALFKPDFYLELDIFKLLYLSAVISSPPYIVLMGTMAATLSIIEEAKKYNTILITVCEASIFNILVFSVPLLLKMLFPDMEKLHFVEIIIFLLLVLCLDVFLSVFINRRKRKKN